MYQRCGKGLSASCNCGVAVRAVDDVIVFDRCRRRGSKKTPMVVRSYVQGSLTPGMKIIKYSGGRAYKVRKVFGNWTIGIKSII